MLELKTNLLLVSTIKDLNCKLEFDDQWCFVRDFSQEIPWDLAKECMKEAFRHLVYTSKNGALVHDSGEVFLGKRKYSLEIIKIFQRLENNPMSNLCWRM